MDEAGDAKKPGQGVELLATRIARSKTNVAKWDLNILVFLFVVLVVVIILVSLEIDTIIVAPVATFGLAMIWLMGWRRGKQLFQHYFTEELSSLRQEPSKEVAAFVEQLTSREIQVLNYAAQGFANKRIALELGISLNTVKIFMSRILTKLNASDRTEAVVIAIKHGIISIR